MRCKTEIEWELDDFQKDIKHYEELKKMYEGRGVTDHKEYRKICETIVEYNAKIQAFQWILQEE